MLKDIFSDLQWRGLAYQTTDDANLGNWLLERQRTVYAGFDPTADSLHVGSMLPLVMLRRFQQAGHRVVAVVGGATGMIGDPSGKSTERNLLTRDMLEHNVRGIERQMRHFLDFTGPNPAVVVNNFDWMEKFSFLDFLRDVGKNFPVNVMMAKDSVRSRLESETGISYTEFSYMLLQAWDFVFLYRHFGCELQIGGSDQWGNITAGIDLARRMDGAKLYGLTNPLLTKSDGTKMGKTESGAVWIAPERTSAYQFYQYWINVEDADAGKCLRFLTDLSHAEISALDESRASAANEKASQLALAAELTRLVHGEEGLARAKKASEVLFGGEIGNLSDGELSEIFPDVPSCQVPQDSLDGPGMPLVDAFVASGLSKSKGDARRTIEQGGGYINNRRVDDVHYALTRKDLASETMIVLRSGRKKYALLKTV